MKRFPTVTTALVLANVLAYCVELASGVESTCLTSGFDPARPTLSSALVGLFLHASLTHLIGNMVVLALAGALVEREVGSGVFTALYFMAGLAGVGLHLAVDPGTLVGCSGSLCGLLAVVGVLRPRLLGFVAGFIGWNVWLAWSGTTDGSSFACHLGGFLIGAIFVVFRQSLTNHSTPRFGERERIF